MGVLDRCSRWCGSVGAVSGEDPNLGQAAVVMEFMVIMTSDGHCNGDIQKSDFLKRRLLPISCSKQ